MSPLGAELKRAQARHDGHPAQPFWQDGCGCRGMGRGGRGVGRGGVVGAG